MLTGTADLAALAAGAPTIDVFPVDASTLTDTTCLQVIAEMPRASREVLLPPNLHPTEPAACTVQVIAAGDSPWGAVSLAIIRSSCRAGARARGFVHAVVASSKELVQTLRDTYGLPAQIGEITLRHGYDGTDASTNIDGQNLFDYRGVDPEPLSPADIQYTSSLTLAETPRGLRLVQVETKHAIERVDRLRTVEVGLVGSAVGTDPLRISHPISASVARGTIDLAPVRFLCRTDELAFTGTEAV